MFEFLYILVYIFYGQHLFWSFHTVVQRTVHSAQRICCTAQDNKSAQEEKARGKQQDYTGVSDSSEYQTASRQHRNTNKRPRKIFYGVMPCVRFKVIRSMWEQGKIPQTPRHSAHRLFVYSYSKLLITGITHTSAQHYQNWLHAGIWPVFIWVHSSQAYEINLDLDTIWPDSTHTDSPALTSICGRKWYIPEAFPPSLLPLAPNVSERQEVVG